MHPQRQQLARKKDDEIDMPGVLAEIDLQLLAGAHVGIVPRIVP